MHSVSGCTASLSIQVVALHEDGVVTEAAHPHITLTFTLQLHTFTNVQSGKEGIIRLALKMFFLYLLSYYNSCKIEFRFILLTL